MNQKIEIENIEKFFFENLVLNDNRIRFVEKPRSNKIDIIFGLKFPGIKPILDRIKIFVRENIIKKFWMNENSEFIKQAVLEKS